MSDDLVKRLRESGEHEAADRIIALEACVRELADDLARELDARYPASVRAYPCMEHDYQADMSSVRQARELVP